MSQIVNLHVSFTIKVETDDPLDPSKLLLEIPKKIRNDIGLAANSTRGESYPITLLGWDTIDAGVDKPECVVKNSH